MLRGYGFLGLVRVALSWLLTKLLFPGARLVRFPIYVRGRAHMRLGRGFTTGVGVRLDAFPRHPGDPVLLIADNVQINDAVHIGAIEQVTIGEDTLIASRVFISDHNHGQYQVPDTACAPTRPPTQRPLYSKPVRIGRNVWIGENVSVLSGVTIGDGAIIGAGAVVTRDVPPGCIAAGNPARVLRRYDTESGLWDRV